MLKKLFLGTIQNWTFFSETRLTCGYNDTKCPISVCLSMAEMWSAKATRVQNSLQDAQISFNVFLNVVKHFGNIQVKHTIKVFVLFLVTQLYL